MLFVNVTSFLIHWYQCWDKLFLEKKNPGVASELGFFVHPEQCEIVLPSGTVRSRLEFEILLQKLQSSDFSDRHTLIGIKQINENGFVASVRYVRPEVNLLLHTRVEIEFVEVEGKLKILKYIPIFSLEEIAIRKMMNTYLLSFQRFDIDSTRSFYTNPVLLTSSMGLLTLSGQAQIDEFLKSTFESLKNQDFTKSSWEEMNIHILSLNSAVVSTCLKRFDKDGNVIFSTGATYQLVKIDSFWKILFGTVHSSSAVIR